MHSCTRICTYLLFAVGASMGIGCCPTLAGFPGVPGVIGIACPGVAGVDAAAISCERGCWGSFDEGTLRVLPEEDDVSIWDGLDAWLLPPCCCCCCCDCV